MMKSLRLSVKVGDLVRNRTYSATERQVGLVLFVNEEGGTLKVFSSGRIKWFITSCCEVASEGR